jgi:uracil phosphoribosyltransferase
MLLSHVRNAATKGATFVSYADRLMCALLEIASLELPNDDEVYTTVTDTYTNTFTCTATHTSGIQAFHLTDSAPILRAARDAILMQSVAQGFSLLSSDCTLRNASRCAKQSN